MKPARILGTVLLSAACYVIGMVLMGVAATLLHLPMPREIASSDPQRLFLLSAACAPMLILGLLPLAAGLAGSWLRRCLAICALLYVTLGLNTLLELKIFSTLLDGNPWLTSLPWLVPAFMTAAVVANGVPTDQSASRTLATHSLPGLGWRLLVAWLSFPVIYFFFGMCIGPIVIPYYSSANDLGLHVPGIDLIVRTVLVRSATFLLASLPVIVLWSKSRGRLIVALGLAHAMTVGIFQLAPATFLPPILRVVHGLEITCDSFAYAAVLALLFMRSGKVGIPQTTSTALKAVAS